MYNQEEYESSWQWTVDHSQYHFDKWHQDKPGEWFNVLGRFAGDWSKELADIESKAAPMNWETRKFYGKDDLRYSPMLEQEERDIAAVGGDPKMTITHMYDELADYPLLSEMAAYFDIQEPKVRIHVQKLGDMFNLHIDKLWERDPENPENVIRMTVMLSDWEPGQFYMYGNFIYDRWHAGDVHIFDWPNVPHATANASRKIRSTLQITGLKSARTRELLAAATPETIYQIGVKNEEIIDELGGSPCASNYGQG
jgi:hypothetical protein